MIDSGEFSTLQVTAVGEVLWDMVGDQRYLGGAPFNFAYHACCLGAKANIVTRVGADDLGSEIRQRATALNMDTTFIQRDLHRRTGIGRVDLMNGDAVYHFPEDSAWDHLELTEPVRELVERSTIIYLGTLAQRTASNRLFYQTVVGSAPRRAMVVADLNLRAPHYDEAVIRNTLDYCTLLKLNAEELGVLRNMFGLAEEDTRAIRTLMDNHNINVAAISRGAEGAEAFGYQQHASVPAIQTSVADTIGAGDAFTAAFALMMAIGRSLQESLELAVLAGGYVSSQDGATPCMNLELLQEFRRENLRGPL